MKVALTRQIKDPAGSGRGQKASTETTLKEAAIASAMTAQREATMIRYQKVAGRGRLVRPQSTHGFIDRVRPQTDTTTYHQRWQVVAGA